MITYLGTSGSLLQALREAEALAACLRDPATMAKIIAEQPQALATDSPVSKATTVYFEWKDDMLVVYVSPDSAHAPTTDQASAQQQVK